MLFGEKLRTLRLASHLSQTELAKTLNVSLRTIQNYESGRSYPKKTEIYSKISELFNVTADYLITESDRYIMNAEAKGGKTAARDVKELIAEVGGLFAGGDISDDDKEKVMRTINELYWKARDSARRGGSGVTNSDPEAEDAKEN